MRNLDRIIAMRMKLQSMNLAKFLVLCVFLSVDAGVSHFSSKLEADTIVFCHKLIAELGLDLEFNVNLQDLDTLEKINEFMQKHCLRKSHFRFQEKAKAEDAEKIEKIKPILKELGMLRSFLPNNSNPDYLVILGATVPSMRKRVKYALNLISDEVKVLMHKDRNELHPKSIVMLTSQRPLDVNIENEKVLFDLSSITKQGWFSEYAPKNEAQAAVFIWGQLAKSEETESVKFEVIATEKSEGTKETVELFLKELKKRNERGKKIVFVSDNPFAPYQNQVIEEVFVRTKSDCEFETIAPAAEIDKNTPLSVLLDNVARYVYAMIEVKKHKEKA